MSSSNNVTDDLTKLYNMIFNKTTLLLIIWFLAMHFVCYRLVKFFFSENLDTLDYQSKLSRMLDIAVFSFLLLFLVASYYSVPEKDKETMLENLANSTRNYINDTDSVYKTVVVLLLFYCTIYLFRIPMNIETKPAFISWIEFIVWTLFLIIVFVKFFKDVFDFSMIDIIYSYLNWSGLPETSSDFNSIKVSSVVKDSDDLDDGDSCEEDEEQEQEQDQVRYEEQRGNVVKSTPLLSRILYYITPAPVNKSSKSEIEYPTTYKSTTNSAISSNISANTSTTNNLRTNTVAEKVEISTTNSAISSNISANTSTTNNLRTNTPTTSDTVVERSTSKTPSLNSNAGPTPTPTPTPSPSATQTSSTNTPVAQSGFRNKRENFDTINSQQSDNISTDMSEVFNVFGNFTYDDAQVVCAAYGAKLANYDQIENTYNNGGEWCNYGWSDGQNAYFPTQKSTWNALQKNSNPQIKHKCGRQGINGGYVADSTKQMGINCYGPKPPPTDTDVALLQQQQSIVNAKTTEDLELESKIQFWKDKISEGDISINYYNQSIWSNFNNDKTKTPLSVPSTK